LIKTWIFKVNLMISKAFANYLLLLVMMVHILLQCSITPECSDATWASAQDVCDADVHPSFKVVKRLY